MMRTRNHLKTDAETKGESDEDDQPRESGEKPAAQADPVLSFFCWAGGGDHLDLDLGGDRDGHGDRDDGDDQGNLDDRQIPSSPSSAGRGGGDELLIMVTMIMMVVVQVVKSRTYL